MGRPADPRRRARTLAAAADYVLAHGLAGLSLRPLASALGTSTRMLLYDFSSKEELIIAVLAEIRRREAAMLAEHTDAVGASGPELVQAVWDWAGSAERAPFMRVFFEVYIDAIAHPGTYSQQGRAMVTEWLDQFGAALAGTPAGAAGSASATLVIAVLRGLLLDRLSTGDQERTDRALDLFTQLIARQERRPGALGETGSSPQGQTQSEFPSFVRDCHVNHRCRSSLFACPRR